MSVSIFSPNQVVCFQTNYCKNRRDFTGYRYYLLKEIDKEKDKLIFFPITSNRSRNWVIFGQYKVKKRPSCLDSKLYPESFVNTNCLIKVPFKVINFLERNCKNKHKTCLYKEDFQEIVILHKFLLEFQSLLPTDIEEITLTESNFVFKDS